MKRILIVLVLLLPGCQQDEKIPKFVQVSARLDYKPSLCWSIGLHQVPTPINVPVPVPPKPGICPNCDGRGYMLGDTVTKPVCPVCKGSGKTPVPSEVSILKPSYFVLYDDIKYSWDGSNFVASDGTFIGLPTPIDIERTEYLSICKNNTCRLIKVQKE